MDKKDRTMQRLSYFSISFLLLSTHAKCDVLSIWHGDRKNQLESTLYHNQWRILNMSIEKSAKLNKEGLVEMAPAIGISMNKANEAIGIVTDLLKMAFDQKKGVTLRSFGTFEIKTCPGHNGTNPRTKKLIWVDEKIRVTFKLSDNLLDKLNQA